MANTMTYEDLFVNCNVEDDCDWVYVTTVLEWKMHDWRLLKLVYWSSHYDDDEWTSIYVDNSYLTTVYATLEPEEIKALVN